MRSARYSLLLGIFCFITYQSTFSQGFGWVGQVAGSTANINNLSPKGTTSDPAGNLYIVGLFAGTVDFDPGQGVFNLSAVNPAFGGEDAFIMKLSPGGTLIWAKSVGSTQIDVARSVSFNPNGYIDIIGDFRGTTDFDPGAGVTNLTPASTNADVFILRLDMSGNFINVNRIASTLTSISSVGSIVHDNQGNSIISFTCNNTIDFDPGPAVFNVTTNISDIVICKYSPNWSLLWAKPLLGTSAIDGVSQLSIDGNNNLLLSGHFSNTVDFDPSPAVFYLTSDGAFDTFVAKFDLAGNLFWARNFRNAGQMSLDDFQVDPAGDIYCTGSFTGPTDFDPGSGTFILNSTVKEAYVAKLESNGNFGWAGKFGITGGNADGVTSIQMDNEGILNVTVNFRGDIDTDPGAGVSTIISNGDADIALVRLERTGLFMSSRRIGSTQYEYISNATVDDDGSIFYTGQFKGTTDFDPGPANTSLTSLFTEANIFLLKFSGVNYIKGKAFLDNNGDGVQQTGEPKMTNVLMKATRNNLDYYGVSDSNGHYRIEVDPGTYIITPKLPLYFSSIIPTSHSAAFGSSTGQTDTANHFGLIPATSTYDARVSLTNVGPARPGFFVTYRITYENVGTQVISGNIILTPDPQLSTISSFPPANPTNSWSFSNLAPSETRNIDVVFRVSPQAVLGTYLQLYVALTTTATDFNPFDNIDSLRHVITGSFDPNDKRVFPDSAISTNFISNGGLLDYTIRFQNTGTDTAFTVVVKDTLSSNLDFSSFKMTAASHRYSVNMKGNGAVEWHFNNILLPDSNINEPGSHGFVRFKIKPKNSLAAGNQIKNKAYIYFDYNLPVITNETVNFVTVVTSVSPPGNGPEVKIYPNPANVFLIIETIGFFDYSIIDEGGKKVLSQNRQHNSVNVNTASLPKGIYFVKIETSKGHTVQKMIIH